MKQAEEILRIIEGVDPADTAKLDEIDARVWCLLENIEFLHMRNDKPYAGGFEYRSKSSSLKSINVPSGIVRKYTRSRDALKAIRPEGTVPIKLFTDGHVVRFELLKTGQPWPDQRNIAQSAWLPTEELAELHCIIQAIAFEREKNGGAG